MLVLNTVLLEGLGQNLKGLSWKQAAPASDRHRTEKEAATSPQRQRT